MKTKDQTPATDGVDSTDFLLSSLSHELRTPLSAILLWTKVLSEQGEPSKQQLKEGLRAIRECAEEQDALIEDIVDDSRVAVGKIVLRPELVSVREQIELAIDPSMREAESKKIAINAHYDARLGEVAIDPRRFRQIIASLTDQAVKRSPVGGRVWIGGERRGSQVELTVRDSGPNLSADELQHIFDRVPLGPARWKTKGSSLYTASRLSILLSGSLVVRNNGREPGALFVLTLPVFPAAADGEGPAKTREKSREAGAERRMLPELSQFRHEKKNHPLINNLHLGLA